MQSPLYHPNDVEQLTCILRTGYIVYENSEKFQLLEKLKKQGFVDYEVIRYCKCYNMNDEDYDNEHGESCNGELDITEEVEENGYGIATCGRMIHLDCKNEFFRKYKVIIMYASVIRFLKKVLKEVGSTCEPGGEGVFYCTYKGKDFILALCEMCINDFILSNAELDSPILYLSIGPLPISQMNILNEWKYLTLAQILCDEKKENLDERITLVTNKLTNTIPQKTIRDFEKFLEIIESGHLFEDFINQFLQVLKNRPLELEDYLALLQKNSNNIVGSKTIKIGGAGNPDFIQFQKYKYMEAGLESEKSGEIKRYVTASLNEGQFWTIIHKHAKGKENVLIITTEEKISPSIWLAVWGSYLENNHEWNHVIWDRWALLDIMYHTKTFSLLEEWCENYESSGS